MSSDNRTPATGGEGEEEEEDRNRETKSDSSFATTSSSSDRKIDMHLELSSQIESNNQMVTYLKTPMSPSRTEEAWLDGSMPSGHQLYFDRETSPSELTRRLDVQCQRPRSSQKKLPSKADERSSGISSSYTSDSSQPSHRAIHRFSPRHYDEIALEVGDPIFVQYEAEDNWCRGVNLRTCQVGIFPSVHIFEVDLDDELLSASSLGIFLQFHPLDGTAANRNALYSPLHCFIQVLIALHECLLHFLLAFKKCFLTLRIHGGTFANLCLNVSERATFFLTYLGSVEVAHHKGNEVVVQAINKTLQIYQNREESIVPHAVLLDISYKGIHMIDKSARNWFRCARFDYFYSLQNISFCGAHPKQLRYFGFITKHPLLPVFACHTFMSKASTQPVVEAIGRAFQRSYNEYMAFSHPTEDIYLE
ncbi:jnk interacting protein (jip) [Trichuris trichiura]|uniref:Jnk interacting protein (Jip) n=1 Tax=Trichuris trichiura TaxID=36087 RepID=A0A077Z896_TRITR|nr:jnk interacting protein (jip) [Trichuris trichiura]